PLCTSSAYSYTCPAMKKAPIRKLRMYHSCMPHRVTCHNGPLRTLRNSSAAQTPIWQVTELSTSTRVLIDAKVTLWNAWPSAQTSGPATAWWVKYIAKRPAKNISSEESQTIVPTWVRFGRLTARRGAGGGEVADDTMSLWRFFGSGGDLLPSVLRLSGTAVRQNGRFGPDTRRRCWRSDGGRHLASEGVRRSVVAVGRTLRLSCSGSTGEVARMRAESTVEPGRLAAGWKEHDDRGSSGGRDGAQR